MGSGGADRVARLRYATEWMNDAWDGVLRGDGTRSPGPTCPKPRGQFNIEI